MEALSLAGIPLGAYLLGSIPFGLVWTRLFAAGDIRQRGSGNIGATNVARVAGAKLGLATLLCDFLKGFLPAALAYRCTPTALAPEAFAALAALAAVGGHLYPVYTGFRGGGKGVATLGGGFTALSGSAVFAAVAVFLVVFFIGRRVSAASLAAVAVLPAALWAVTAAGAAAGCALIAAAFVFFRHRENIRRLLNGTEPAFVLSRKRDRRRRP